MKVVHPGKIFRENFMYKFGLSETVMAESIFVDRSTVNRLRNENQDISPEMALRLGKLFGNGPDFWINLQNVYNLENAKRDISAELKKIKPLKAVGK